MNLISVNDRLPEPETDVLVIGHNGHREEYAVAGLFYGEWLSRETEDKIKFEPVAWCELLKINKEQK